MKERPEYVVNFKKPAATEIKEIGGNWYLYERSYVYDPSIRRSRKVSGPCLGKITANGLVPSKRRMVKTDQTILSDTIDVGSVIYYWERTAALRARLREAFPGLWQAIYCIVLLRLFKDVRFKRLQLHLENSLLGHLFPEVYFSAGTITSLLRDLGKQRDKIAALMREDLDSRDAFILFDGHRLITSSNYMEFAELGYDSKMRFKPQTNLLYVFSLTEEGGIPGYYKQYVGSTPDVSAFKDILKESHLKGDQYTIVGDKGFGSEDGFDQIGDSGLNYIIPLKRGNRYIEAPDSPAKYAGMFTFHKRAIHFKSFAHEGFVVWLFYDAQLYANEVTDVYERQQARNEARTRRREKLASQGKELPKGVLEELKLETFEDMHEKHPEMGTFSIRTNRKDLSGEDVYRIYKRRQAIEQFFKTYGETLEFEASYMRSRTSQEAWLFLNHLSAQLGMASLEEIEATGEKKNVSLEDLHQALGKITASKILGQWQIAPIKKSVQSILGRLKVEVSEANLKATFDTAALERASHT